MKMTLKNSYGFTLIELLLAMAFFSFVLLFVTAGFMQVTSSYSRGITTKKVHETGRRIMEDVTREIRQTKSTNVRFTDELGNDAANPDDDGFVLCAKSKYIYDPSDLQMYVDSAATNCTTTAYGASTVRLTNPDEVAVRYFKITQNGSTFTIELGLSSSRSTDDLLNLSSDIEDDQVKCNPGVTGQQYCDVLYQTTTVTSRS